MPSAQPATLDIVRAMKDTGIESWFLVVNPDRGFLRNAAGSETAAHPRRAPPPVPHWNFCRGQDVLHLQGTRGDGGARRGKKGGGGWYRKN